MTNATEELRQHLDRMALKRLREGIAHANQPAPKPMYLLRVEASEPLDIVLTIRQGKRGQWTGKLTLPRWNELPAGWDGPHLIAIAFKLVDGYAQAYGYEAVAIDIESSQLWDAAWGDLVTGPID